MDLKQEPSNLHEWVVKTEPDVDTGQTEQPFKNFESKCEYSASEHIVNVSQIKEETNECIVPKIEYQEKIDCDSIQFVSGTIKKELDVRDLVNISEIKQEVSDSEYIQAKTERELLNTDCDLPTLKNESAEYSDIILQPCSSKYAEKTLKTIRNVISNKKKKKKLYPCLVCQKNLSSSESRSKHINRHFGKIFVVCEFCGKFMTKIDFFRHYFVHLVKNEPIKRSLRNKVSSIDQHLIIDTSDKPFKCELCFKQFKRKYDRNNHLKIHTNKKPFKCEICFKQFKRKSNLNSHLIIHTNEKPFQCGICFKPFNNKNNLHKHSIIHTNDKPFKCHICSKEYKRKYTLKQHLKFIHTNKKSFNRFKQFKRKSIFKSNNHLRIHTKKKSFKCDMCSKEYTRNYYLQEHLKIIHTDQESFKCDICHKKFNRTSYLHKHLKVTHSNDKPFKCDICSKEFKRKYDLQRHIKGHSMGKTLRCNICAKTFKRKDYFVAHLLIHTDNNKE